MLGVVTTGLRRIWANRRLFVMAAGAGRVTVLEGLFCGLFGLVSLGLGWYFNVRYTHVDPHASYVNYIKALFSNWASDSAAQDYTMVNIVLLPLWTIVDGRRRSMRASRGSSSS